MGHIKKILYRHRNNAEDIKQAGFAFVAVSALVLGMVGGAVLFLIGFILLNTL